jgi:Niemann-Pick C2 protein
MLIFGFLAGLTAAVKFKDCGSDGLTIKSVNITPCAREPCELVHGQTYAIEIDFDEQVEDTLKFEVCGMIGPVCVPFPTGVPDQKVNPGINKFTYSMPILDVYPNIKLIGKFQLVGKNKMCILLPLKIMPKPESLKVEGIFDEVEDNVEKVYEQLLHKIETAEEKLDQL